jgi:ribose 5-phosphate isomerase B
MRIAVGNNHRGYPEKLQLVNLLDVLGHQVEDFGCKDTTFAEYPDVALAVAMAVGSGQCNLGVLIAGNGMGMCMVANKVNGVRAAVVQDEFSARYTRERHHCNLLCLGVDLSGGIRLKPIMDGFLSAQPAEGRYGRMVEKMMQIERESKRTQI